MSKFDYPEEVEQRHMDIIDAVAGIDIARLRELASAEREGRLVVLPDCKKCKNYAARDALYPQCIGVVYPCEGCVGLIKIKRYPNNKFEAADAGKGE